MSGQPEDALEVLREVWSAQGQTSMRPEDDGSTKACKKMAAVGFDAFASEADGDLRAGWRARLEREGKLAASSGSLADLVLGPAEARRS